MCRIIYMGRHKKYVFSDSLEEEIAGDAKSKIKP
jgi:hypothetical protein